ncbi:MAG: hypothetical protein IKD55_00350 [Sediminibacterium sp.]|nr:hypothetical protein [Sediminibacterium sp.]
MKNLTIILTIFGFLILTVSCEQPKCKNTNLIFDKYSPYTKQYKDELVKQLINIDKSKLTYWMDEYQEIDNSQNICANIQGDGLCAKIVLVVRGSDKGIQGILNAKGKGYRGAELKDLKFDIKQDNLSTEFVFKEISRVID